ncbi:ABC transporter permease subunit [Arthrobacter sp. CDRTa11]|uniref:ABC transporter permease subunit n=1 Tax=Arthrobacter sp. CDRTa11 TaxID=2651199 RepID=UPI003A5CE55A
MDGATPFTAFRRVILPLAVPGLATTAILMFISVWNEFLLAVTLTTSPEARPVPVERHKTCPDTTPRTGNTP